ncbi:MAG: tetratricopeptide repeat protein, partial [Chloroflexota bacterium]
MKKSSIKNIPNQRIFLGRIEEQKRFRTILEEFQATGSREEYPHVVLISGDAGMGKTSLKRRFQDIVQKESPFSGKFKVLTIDWADERKKMPGLQVARDHIEAQVVFRAIHNEAIRRKWGRQFLAYNKAIKQAHEVDKQVAEVLAASSNEDEIAILRRAGVPAIARIVRWRAPFIGEAGEQIIESLLGVGIQIASEQLTHLNNRLHVYLQANLKPNHFDYFLNPNEQLAHQLARGLENVAKSKRLVVFVDSYEIIDRNDIWIRSVIREAGPRVLWVICGRNELVHSRQFGDEFFKGYADDWPRHLTSFNMWPLSVADISEYFSMQGRELNKEEVNSLSMVTRGRPLAVHEAAAVISAGESLEEVLSDMMKVSGNDKIMRSMTDSYLKHVVADEDRKAIYALVLARGDVDTLRAMLTPEGQKRFNLEKLLQRLERDYSTVMADHARLHDEHSEFVHEYLKNEVHRSSSIVQELVGKAVTFLREKLIKIETDLELLEERCREDNWVQAVVHLTQYLLWIDERDTFMLALPRFVEGLAYNKKLCQAILRSLEEWYDQLSPGGREIFNGLNVFENKFISIEEEGYLLDTLSRMEERGWLNGEKEAGGRKERQAIKDLRSGNHAFKQKQYGLARERFAKVEDGLPEGGVMLRTQLAEALSRMAQVLSMPDGRDARYNPESETLLERANQLLPEEHWTWFELGLVRQQGSKPADALAAFEQAAELNPKHEVTRLNIGDSYLALEQHDKAIESYEQASKMKTGFAAPRIGLGDVYLALGELGEAEKFYKRALKIDEKALEAWQKLGDLYSQQSKLEQAQAAFQNAGTIRPSSGTADIGRAKILYDRGEEEKAQAALETAREKGEITAELHLLQGHIDRNRGDLLAAV